jgi:hypothetical protein
MPKRKKLTSFENSYLTKSIIQMWPKEIPQKKNHFSKFGDFFSQKLGIFPFILFFRILELGI